VALVIPGGWTAPTDQETIDFLNSLYGRADAQAVKWWERDHSDMSAGGGFPATEDYLNLTYVELQAFAGSTLAAAYRYAQKNNINWEDMFLHFKEDSFLNHKTVNNVRWYRGWFDIIVRDAGGIANSYVVGDQVPLNIAISSGGYVYFVVVSSPFDRAFIELSTSGEGGGSVSIEYCNQVNTDDVCTGWAPVSIQEDTTNNMTQNGTIRWKVPQDWKWCKYGIQIGGAFVVRLRSQGYTRNPVLYRVKTFSGFEIVSAATRTVQVVSATANTVRLPDKWIAFIADFYKDFTIRVVSGPGAGQERVVTGHSWSSSVLNISPDWETIPTSESVIELVGPALKVYGWDPANDTNGDGYVDDAEYANRVNPNASARAPFMARIVDTQMSLTVMYRTNLWNEHVLNSFAQWLAPPGTTPVVGGYYNDNYTRLMDWRSLPVFSGGLVLERPGRRVAEEPLVTEYMNTFVLGHSAIRRLTGLLWIGHNVSTYYLYPTVTGRRLMDLGGVSWALCEGSVYGVLDLYGFAQLAHYPAHAARGIVSVIMGHIKWGLVEQIANTREHWERELTNMLAIYYLIQTPEMTAMQFWNTTSTYGSGLTTAHAASYYKAGVPKNMAYIPVGLLRVDIGVPANSIPEGKEALMYMENLYVNGAYHPFSAVGRSTATQVYFADWAGNETGYVPAVPTHIYYLWRSAESAASFNLNGDTGTWPRDTILARKYTKGLVLYRCPYFRPSGSSFVAYVNNEVTVPLDGVYRRVNYDGTLGPPITEITLRGYESAILVSAAETTAPNVQLTVSVDKPNPKSLDVVTVTIEARNVGNTESGEVEIRLPISREVSYEQGSLSPSDVTIDTSDTSVIKITLPSLLPAQSKTVQLRLIVH